MIIINNNIIINIIIIIINNIKKRSEKQQLYYQIHSLLRHCACTHEQFQYVDVAYISVSIPPLRSCINIIKYFK